MTEPPSGWGMLREKSWRSRQRVMESDLRVDRGSATTPRMRPSVAKVKLSQRMPSRLSSVDRAFS